MHSNHTLRLAPTTEAPGLARGFLRDKCRGLPVSLVDDACLLASEVVTNAVLHAQTMITLDLDCEGGHIEVAVQDDGDPAEFPRATAPRPVMWEGGRGLTIVDNVARDWGVRPSGAGKAVWFRLP